MKQREINNRRGYLKRRLETAKGYGHSADTLNIEDIIRNKTEYKKTLKDLKNYINEAEGKPIKTTKSKGKAKAKQKQLNNRISYLNSRFRELEEFGVHRSKALGKRDKDLSYYAKNDKRYAELRKDIKTLIQAEHKAQEEIRNNAENITVRKGGKLSAKFVEEFYIEQRRVNNILETVRGDVINNNPEMYDFINKKTGKLIEKEVDLKYKTEWDAKKILGGYKEYNFNFVENQIAEDKEFITNILTSGNNTKYISKATKERALEIIEQATPRQVYKFLEKYGYDFFVDEYMKYSNPFAVDIDADADTYVMGLMETLRTI